MTHAITCHRTTGICSPGPLWRFPQNPLAISADTVYWKKSSQRNGCLHWLLGTARLPIAGELKVARLGRMWRQEERLWRHLQSSLRKIFGKGLLEGEGQPQEWAMWRRSKAGVHWASQHALSAVHKHRHRHTHTKTLPGCFQDRVLGARPADAPSSPARCPSQKKQEETQIKTHLYTTEYRKTYLRQKLEFVN